MRSGARQRNRCPVLIARRAEPVCGEGRGWVGAVQRFVRRVSIWPIHTHTHTRSAEHRRVSDGTARARQQHAGTLRSRAHPPHWEQKHSEQRERGEDSDTGAGGVGEPEARRRTAGIVALCSSKLKPPRDQSASSQNLRYAANSSKRIRYVTTTCYFWRERDPGEINFRIRGKDVVLGKDE